MSRERDGSDAAGLTETELDRLADYLADVLEPADAAEVSRLVAEDSRWSATHAALVPADAVVRETLAAAGAATDPMPADIAARLDDAMRDLGRTPDVSTESAPIDLASARARRLRRRRWLTGVATAAAAVVAVIGGVSVAANLIRSDNATTSSTALGNADAPGSGKAASGEQVPPAASQPGLTVLASGTDYTTGTLGQLSVPQFAAGEADGALTPQDSAKANANHVPQQVRDLAPRPLARLLDPAALSACLDAIRAVTPGVVAAVDYARFAGEPALVVLVRQGGNSTVIAVGPDCGRTGVDKKGSASMP